VIARLQAREAELVTQSERLAEAEAAAAAAAETQREAAAALARREREIGLKARDAVDAAVAETRAALAQIVREAQAARDPRAAAAGRAELERVAAEALARLPTPPKPPAAAELSLVAGSRVFVARLNADGVVLEPPDARGRVKVSAGALTIEVTADELAPPKTTAREAARAGGRAKPATRHGSSTESAAPSDDLALVAATARRTVDVRGQNGDEALAALDAYLDRAALSGETHVVVVHGHGTGALRKRVRAHLDASPYVARWAPGTPHQGGDGASIIELR
jgi:DNA mismatch repair protein MutS2